MPAIKREKLLLHTVPDENLCKVVEALTCCYDLDRLATLFHSVMLTVNMGRNSCLITSQGQERPCPQIELLFRLTKPKRTKQHYAQVLAYFVASPENFRYYFDRLPERVQAMWILLMRRRMVECGSPYHAIRLLSKDDEHLAWFSMTGEHTSFLQVYNRLYVVPESLYPYLFEALASRAFPEGVPQVRLHALPVETKWMNYSLTSSLPVLIQLLEQMQGNGFLDTTPRLIQLSKSCEVGERVSMPLPAQDLNAAHPTNRATCHLLVQTYVMAQACRYQTGGKTISFHAALRKVMLTLNSRQELAYALFFPHLKVEKKVLASSLALGNALKLLTSQVVDFLSKDSSDWMDLQAEAFRLLGQVPYPCLFGFKTHAVAASSIVNKLQKCPIYVDMAFENLLLPLVKGFAMLCAVMGLAEVGLDPSLLKGRVSYWDAVCYVRFNSMARFVFGLDADEPANDDSASANTMEKPPFELSEDRLLIHLSPGSPYAGLLSDFADPISTTFYQVNVETFMRKCSSTSQIDAKIALFRKMVCRTPPPVWEEFFQNLYLHFDPFERVRLSEFMVFRVDPQRHDLQRLIMSHAKLRSMVIRAEGYMFLIRQNDLDEFTRQLSRLGYYLRL